MANAAVKPASKLTKSTTSAAAPRLRVLYDNAIIKDLQKELELKNPHQVPRLDKIVINIGLGKAKDDKKTFEAATNTLRKISGQQPLSTAAKNSIAGFKLREGNKIGLKVTLRGNRMYEFADRVINLVLPRLRDFHGVNKRSFDQQGNFAIGFIDQSVFPELSFEETTTAHGLQVIFVITTINKEHSRALLEKFGMPFEKERQ
ncbi:MAG TPA: 50S ribosomal protein L5 [Candidatus Saccharimonadales bacterium]|nr:50S ribosomal protein L5 [Candidatus Saccharimonadales bacterium]